MAARIRITNAKHIGMSMLASWNYEAVKQQIEKEG